MRITVHDVVNIRPIVSTFNGFTTYEWVSTDKNGNKVEINFFHDHSTSLVIEPVMHVDHSTKDKQNEDEPTTL